MTNDENAQAGRYAAFSRWYGRQSKARKVGCIALAALLAALLVGGAARLLDHTPSDGASCVGASESEIDAWVGSKEGEIPSSVSKESVESEVASICSAAGSANEPQSFSGELLREAVEAAP